MKAVLSVAFLLIFLPLPAAAHCDTMDGPVVQAARTALEKGDVAPALKWVLPERDAEIRKAFQTAVAARAAGGQARELADRWFFETLVRVHRVGEGAGYTGLKPAGSETSPFVRAADQALQTGSADALVKLVTADVEKGIRQRFAMASERRRTADSSVAAGREFVEAYVKLQHYMEALDIRSAGPEHKHHD